MVMAPDFRLLGPVRDVLTSLVEQADAGVAAASRSIVVGVACSGGRDSMALLDAVVACCRHGVAPGFDRPAGAPRSILIEVLHVHHGLSAQADRWSEHVRRWCQRAALAGAGDAGDVAVAFRERRVSWPRRPGDSVEAEARTARYGALVDMAEASGCAVVLLAHHEDDQAETVLLQALRAAGVAGWSGMGRQREVRGVRFVRPWLSARRTDIDAYVRARGVPYVDDDSNLDPRYARNRLRLQVMPALVAAFPQAGAVLAESARQAQDAASCLADLAGMDLAGLREGAGLSIARLSALSEARRRNVLRHWLVQDLRVSPTRSFLWRVSTEVKEASPTGMWALEPHGELRAYRGVLCWRARQGAISEGRDWPSGWVATVRIQGAGDHPVRGVDGTLMGHLRVTRASAPGPGVIIPEGTTLVLRDREGGERFQLRPGAVARSLKKQYQARGVPAWRRSGPLIWCDRALWWAPGLGLDARIWADPQGPGGACALDWVAGARE